MSCEQPMLNKSMKRFVTIVSIACIAVAVTAEAASDDEHFFYTVVPGQFALIGKYPDGGATYSGTARITYADGYLELVKMVAGETITATGTVERASPGESDVLRFRWPGHEATCLVQMDLDNYSRLSCYSTVEGSNHTEPGLEAYFPTEAWP